MLRFILFTCLRTLGAAQFLSRHLNALSSARGVYMGFQHRLLYANSGTPSTCATTSARVLERGFCTLFRQELAAPARQVLPGTRIAVQFASCALQSQCRATQCLHMVDVLIRYLLYV